MFELFGSLAPWLQQLLASGGAAKAGELGATATVGGAPAVGGLMNALPMFGQLFGANGAAGAAQGGANAIPQLLAGVVMSGNSPQLGTPSMPVPQPAPTAPMMPPAATPSTIPEIQAAGGGARTGGAPLGQIPLHEPPSAWQRALSNTAVVQDMMLKQRAASRIDAAPRPALRSPGAVPAPQLGRGGALASIGAMGPMQRFAALLRSIS